MDEKKPNNSGNVFSEEESMKPYKKGKYAIYIALISLVVMALSGCGIYSDDNHTSQLAGDESIYDYGSPVEAVGFKDAQTIELYVNQTGSNGKASFVKVTNGMFLDPGTYTFGVTATRRKVNGVTSGQRVFISDGGSSFQVEATYDATQKMYVADYKIMGIDMYLTAPILVQVIGDDEKASKAKFIIRTDSTLQASYGTLVDRGLSMTMSKNFLHTLPDLMNPVIAQYVSGLKINDITPADNSSGKQQNGVIGIDVAGLKCDIVLNDTYTSGGNVTRGLAIGVEDVGAGTYNTYLETIVAVFANTLLKNLKLSSIPVMPLGYELNSVISDLSGSSLPVTGIELLTKLTMDMSLDVPILLNLKGYPSETTSDFAVLGGAIYAPKNEDVVTDENGYMLWPSVTVDPTDTGMAAGMSNIKDSATDIGMAISQYNINQILPEMLKGMNITIKDIYSVLKAFAPMDSRDTLDLVLKLNPEGVAMDFSTQRMTANDITIELVESGPGINATIAELSVDMTMLIDGTLSNTDGNLSLNLTIEPIEDVCHMHVMKNDAGGGMNLLDHGRLIPIIFKVLSGGSNVLSLSVPLSDLGITPRADGAAGKVVFDEAGNCFLGMACSGIDMSKLSGAGGCFINTARNF